MVFYICMLQLRCISGSMTPKDNIPKAILMFSRVNFSMIPMPTFNGDSFTLTFKMAPETKSTFILARVVVYEQYFSRLLFSRSANCMSLLSFSSEFIFMPHFKWQWKSTTTILNITSSTCERTDHYVQKRKFRSNRVKIRLGVNYPPPVVAYRLKSTLSRKLVKFIPSHFKSFWL